MKYSVFITKEHQQVLNQARQTYGYKKQLSVAAEELDELAILCNKYQRYDSHDDAVKDLYDKVTGEVADVIIVLDHLINAFGISGESIQRVVDGKIGRLAGWMDQSTSLQVSTVMRDIPGSNTCSTCVYKDIPTGFGPCKDCGTEHVNYRRAKPCRRCVHRRDWKNLAPGGCCFKCYSGEDQFEPIKEG